MAKIAQAGAIVVRPGRDEPRILLVTARRNPRNWIFPKGHVEEGESLKVAALREAREEAGVNGTVARKAGSLVFTFGGNRYRVHYFIVLAANRGTEQEGRRLRWCRYKQALRRLAYDETRKLLREAWPRIRKAVDRPAAGRRKTASKKVRARKAGTRKIASRQPGRKRKTTSRKKA